MRRVALSITLGMMLLGCVQKSEKTAPQLPIEQPITEETLEPRSDLRFDDLQPGDWQVLRGTVTTKTAGADEVLAIAYRFEVTMLDDDEKYLIDWKNDDPAQEQGSFRVPAAGHTLTDHLKVIDGIFSSGQVQRQTSEPYTIGDRTWACERLDLERGSNAGTHQVTLWLSAEGPVSRIIAERSVWMPNPDQAQLAPETHMSVELDSYGDDDGTAWSVEEKR